MLFDTRYQTCRREHPAPHLEVPRIEVAARSQKLDRPPGVIILSMHADESYIIRALAAGARAYLLKDATDDPPLRMI